MGHLNCQARGQKLRAAGAKPAARSIYNDSHLPYFTPMLGARLYDRYLSKEELGRGGTGVIYGVEDILVVWEAFSTGGVRWVVRPLSPSTRPFR